MLGIEGICIYVCAPFMYYPQVLVLFIFLNFMLFVHTGYAQTQTVVCKTAPFKSEIESYRSQFLRQYGALAYDSIEARISTLNQMALNGTLFIEPTLVKKHKPTKITFTGWLTTLFSNATNTADSIDAVCYWIGSNYAYGYTDSELIHKEAPEIYESVVNGERYGQCSDYSIFLAKVSETFPGWGTANVVHVLSDTTITKGDGSPSHVFVEYTNKDNVVWCLADPTLGGIVRNSQNGTPVDVETIRKCLFDTTTAGCLYINKVKQSVTIAGPFIYRITVADTLYPIKRYVIDAKKNIGITIARWRSFDDPVMYSVMVSYWKKKGFARMTYMNLYGEKTRSRINFK